ncbi:hypothetical protein Bca52824_005398 [Brassica carinata]|uniref:Uncharacterized protein n=1 Tax=Brassica carinata TaxID=52824 RepID=A0A8X7WNQ4_BRACI|nr:hypothetical protein Bca52824_005398 [Brassica carinata]
MNISHRAALHFLLMKGEVSSTASVLGSHTGVKSLSPSMALTVAGSTSPPLPPSEPPDPDIGVAFPVDLLTFQSLLTPTVSHPP